MSAQKYAIIGALCVILIFLIAYAVRGSWRPQSAFAAGISEIKDCMAQQDAITCAEPVVKQLLSIATASQIVDALSKTLPPQQCHYAGHVVGEQVYLKYQSIGEAMAECDLTCDSACVHGAVGEAFAQVLGITSTSTTSNTGDTSGMSMPGMAMPGMGSDLTVQQITQAGKQLCTSSDTCHGVGHTLFEYFQKFEPAFSECRQVAGSSRVTPCYNGVVMEYADDLSSRNFLPSENVSAPDPLKLSSFCERTDIQESRACFRYFPRIALATLAPSGQSQSQILSRVQQICTSYTDHAYRDACIAGLGSYDSYSVVSDPTAAAQFCESLGDPRDEAACVLGSIDVGIEDRQQNLMSFCGSLTVSSTQESCYQDMFHFSSVHGATSTSAICGESTACMEGLQQYNLDSWAELLKQAY